MATVRTSSGRVKGHSERKVHAFKGIPYAEAPVGDLRWRPPARRAAWEGVLDAAKYGAVCPQQLMPGVFGEFGTPVQPQDLDCLRLNVWTPDPASNGLPVLVWIHGGAFYAGAGSDAVYNGARFARDGVVCVTINYRLGVEGFLQLDESAGNCGMLDQIAALEWVQENIERFGGDPRNVTIAGESAGGMSVGTLLAMPRARGLFRRAVPQSGAAHNGISAATADKIAHEYLRRLGYDPGDRSQLAALSPERLIAVQEELGNELGATRDPEVFGEAAASAMAFQPVYGTEALPVRPIEAIANGVARDIDLLIGTTAEETLIFIRALADIFNEELVKETVGAVFGPSGRDGSAAFERYRASRMGVPSYELAAAIETDRMFRIPAVRLAEAQLRHNPNVYMYCFAWRSTGFDGAMGAFHFLEVPFVFDTIDDPMSINFTGPNAPQALADAVHGSWVRFVADGQPTHPNLPAWTAYDVNRRATMYLDEQSKVVDDPASTERQLWDGVL